MIISVYGKDGSGKTTIATHLAKHLSEKGHFVGIISAEIRYGDLQRRLGIQITENKSLLNAIIDFENAEEYFTRLTDNLYVLSIDDNSTIKEYENILRILGTKESQTEEQINRIHSFVESVSDIFDFLIIDGTDRINDPITYAFISKSDKTLNVIESSISGVTYCNAHKYLNEFDFYRNKINILNKHYEKAVNRSTLEGILGEHIDVVIPYKESTLLSGIKATVDDKLMDFISSIENTISPEEKKKKSFFKFLRKKENG